MRKSRNVLPALLAGMLALTLTACSKKDGEWGLDRIKDIDSNQSHITLQLIDHVNIDADVTVYDRYKDGLASYYLDYYRELSSEAPANFLEHPTIFGISMTEQLKVLEEFGLGTFDLKNIVVDDTWKDLPQYEWDIPDDDNQDIHFMGIASGTGGATTMASMDCLTDWRSLRIESEGDINKDTKENAPENVDDIVSEIRSFLEKLLGHPVNGKYWCWPLTGEGEGYYAFYMFNDIDGFPCVQQDRGITYEKGAKLSEAAEERAEEGTVRNLRCVPYVVYYGDSRIQSFDEIIEKNIGDVYLEKQPVVDIQEILKQLYNYYDKFLLTNDITISNIELVYNPSISDGSDGEEVCHVIQPYWYVEYYDPVMAGGNNPNQRLIFDAYTGEFVQIGDFCF